MELDEFQVGQPRPNSAQQWQCHRRSPRSGWWSGRIACPPRRWRELRRARDTPCASCRSRSQRRPHDPRPSPDRLPAPRIDSTRSEARTDSVKARITSAAGGVSIGVDNPSSLVSTLSAQEQVTSLVPIKSGAKLHHSLDGCPAPIGQDIHGVTNSQAPSHTDCVNGMLLRGIVGGQRRGNPALAPTRSTPSPGQS